MKNIFYILLAFILIYQFSLKITAQDKQRIYKTSSGYVKVIDNIQVNPTNHDQAEVILTRHPLNPNILFGSANTELSLGRNQGVYVSETGGEDWTYWGRDQMIPQNGINYTDPAPIIDKNGRFIHIFQIKDAIGNLHEHSIYSDDNGRTFPLSNMRTISNGPKDDKPMAATDGSPSSPYFGRSYCAWTHFTALDPENPIQGFIQFSYTVDGGFSWSSPQQINNPLSGHFSQGVDLVVGTDGVLYMIWASRFSTPGPWREDYFGFAKSVDAGATWSVTENAFEIGIGMSGVLRSPNWGITVNSFPRLAIDKTGGPRNGWLYVVYAEWITLDFNSDIFLRYSSNGGTSWSQPIKVNQDGYSNSLQWLPAINIDADGGINILYYDNRNYVSSVYVEVYLSRFLYGGSYWDGDILVSSEKHQPHCICSSVYESDVPTGYAGDYIGITSANGKIIPFWMDNRISVGGIYQVFSAVVIPEPCPPDWIQNQDKDILNGQIFNKCAQNSITVGNPHTFTIERGGSSTLAAGNVITLLPGFYSMEGSFFQALVSPLNDYKKNISNNQIVEPKHKENPTEEIPENFFMLQNYPNPFNSETSIKYGLKYDSKVTLTIYDILGREVRMLANEEQRSGYKNIFWGGKNNQGSEVSSGIYFVRIIATNISSNPTKYFETTKKMLVIK